MRRERGKNEARCSDCRWIALWPQPYGSVEYFCSRRQETLRASGLARRCCQEFEAP
ncbi:MAG: hypothetical protein KGO96_04370 [Elusimicrobia bacterium]|nr:hypothetical protein [Elusimicrobiota bacterium]MDE2425127.1 hypothetical protein [Elusimicrobiota bacterium]